MLQKAISYIKNPLLFFNQVICKIRSVYYSRLIDTGNGKIIISDSEESINYFHAL